MTTATVRKPLTHRQEEVLHVIESWTREHGYPPTIRELGAALGVMSSSTVHCHLKALERKGRIERVFDHPRAIKVLYSQSQTCPLCGR